MRVSKNVIFIETPSVSTSLDARGFDDGEFTYDDHDDMLRDVRNYTSNHSADSLSLERAVGDAVWGLSAIGHSYAFTVKGKFPDVAHRDGTFGFTQYAYAVGTTQPNVPRTIKEAWATPKAAQWNAAAERKIACLKDRLQAFFALCHSRWTEANQFEMGVQAQGGRLLQGSCSGSRLELRSWP